MSTDVHGAIDSEPGVRRTGQGQISVVGRRSASLLASFRLTAVGFEPTPLRTGAWSQRLRPLGQTVMWHHVCKAVNPLSSSHRCCCSSVGVHTGFPGVSHHSAQVYLACAPVTSAVCMSSPYHPSWPWCRCMIRWQRAIAGPVAGLCFCVCVPRVCSVPCVSAPGPLSCEP